MKKLTRDAFARINVVGTSGSGKSTFAKKLAARLGHPYIEMDLLFWEPNWTEPRDEVFFARLTEALAGDAWILDGNYSRTTDVKWRNVRTVVWLDYSFPRVFAQALKRGLSRGIRRHELWPGTGNRESLFKLFFSKKSILLWTIQTYDRMKNRYTELSQSPEWAHLHFIRLRSPAEAIRWLESLDKTH